MRAVRGNRSRQELIMTCFDYLEQWMLRISIQAVRGNRRLRACDKRVCISGNNSVDQLMLLVIKTLEILLTGIIKGSACDDSVAELPYKGGRQCHQEGTFYSNSNGMEQGKRDEKLEPWTSRKEKGAPAHKSHRSKVHHVQWRQSCLSQRAQQVRTLATRTRAAAPD